MTSAPSKTALRWPWLDRIFGAWLALMFALYLGLSLVALLKIDCRPEPIYLTTVNGDPLTLEDEAAFLVAEQRRRECRLAVANAFAFPF